jgi:hypothetical protein
VVSANVNFLGENVGIIRKDRKVLLVASDKFGLGMNAEKSYVPYLLENKVICFRHVPKIANSDS